jgi:hypothetical protein
MAPSAHHVAGRTDEVRAGREPVPAACSWGLPIATPVSVEAAVALRLLGEAEVGDAHVVAGVDQHVLAA